MDYEASRKAKDLLNTWDGPPNPDEFIDQIDCDLHAGQVAVFVPEWMDMGQFEKIVLKVTVPHTASLVLKLAGPDLRTKATDAAMKHLEKLAEKYSSET